MMTLLMILTILITLILSTYSFNIPKLYIAPSQATSQATSAIRFARRHHTSKTKLYNSNTNTNPIKSAFSSFISETKATPQTEPHPCDQRNIQPSNSVINMPPTSPTTGRKLPSHETTVTGVLPNGFSYIILPNASPPGRFEAHLQVFTGSANELQHQQGIAHLTEHVAYMGSTKREVREWPELGGKGGGERNERPKQQDDRNNKMTETTRRPKRPDNLSDQTTKATRQPKRQTSYASKASA